MTALLLGSMLIGLLLFVAALCEVSARSDQRIAEIEMFRELEEILSDNHIDHAT